MKLIIAMISILGAGAIFFLYTRPAYDSAQMVSAQMVQYNAALDKATELQQLKQSLLSKYNAFDPSALDRLQKLLPDHVDNIALILDLDSIANRYGLPLQNVDVSTVGSPSSGNTVGAIGGGSQLYDSVTLHFSTQSTYATFLQFMSDLESSLRIVDLTALTVASAASESGKAGVYTYSITLQTYWLK